MTATFKYTATDVAIANRALGMVGESRYLTTINDAGNAARVVRQWYIPVVARLLEMHHWNLATKRVAMVATTNTKADEWLYAYTTPADMAFPVTVALLSGLSTVSYYRGLSGLMGLYNGEAVFLYQNDIIYSNLSGDLEYVSYATPETEFTATFENIVTLMLASRLALELPKDPKLADAFAQQAVTEINLAIAQNLNVGNRKYGMTVSESEVIRGAGGDSWDYFPRAAG